MQWHRVQLTSAQVAGLQSLEVHAQFKKAFTETVMPMDVAMLTAGIADDGMLDLYFSPATTQHAKLFLRTVDAKSCASPPTYSALLVGHAEALERIREGNM